MRELHSDLAGMMEGLNRAADAVASTIGPNGRNVFVDDPYSPKITNDGARIANSIHMTDPLADKGAFLVNNCAAKTNDDVGDGTTTTVVLLQAIVKLANAYIKEKNISPSVVRTSLLEATKKAVELLKAKSKKATIKDVKQVALISGEYPDLAEIIEKIVNELGPDALITVEDSKTYETSYEVIEGYEAKAGFLSPWFINDNKAHKAVFEDVPVFVSAKRIATVQNLQNVISAVTSAGGNSVAIFTEDIDEKVLGVLVGLKLKGQLDVVVVKAIPDELEDIAGATGAVAVGASSGVDFAQVGVKHLGKANKLIVSNHSTLIIGDPENAKIQANNLEVDAEHEPNQFLKEKYKVRAARLRGKIAVLRVGANSDLAREHKKDKAEDAVKAVPAALAEGLVPGAGVAWAQVAKELGDSVGENILAGALQAPYLKILENAGRTPDNPFTGVLDPTKVERVALENAAEAAGIFITTSHAVIDHPDGKKQ